MKTKISNSEIKMKKEKKQTKLLDLQNLRLVFFSIITGAITGLVVSCYIFLVENISHMSFSLYDGVKTNPWLIIALIGGVFAGAYIMETVLKQTKTARGGGVAYCEGLLRGTLKSTWYIDLPAVFFLSLLSVFFGLAVGAEGPAILVGCLTAQGVAKVFRQPIYYERYMMTGGAAAGMAVAFNAPFAGIAFAFEEGQRRFSPMIMISTIVTVSVSILISLLLLGSRITFNFGNIEFSHEIIWMLLILGLLTGLLGMLFNKFYKVLNKLSNKFKVKGRNIIIYVVFFLTMIIAIFVPEGTHTGTELIKETSNGKFIFQTLLMLMFLRLFLTIFTSSSGVCGGILIPMLTIGAIIGGISFLFFQSVSGLDGKYLSLFVLLGMTGFFASVVKAPITCVVLSLELSGSYITFTPALIVIMISYVITQLFKGKPLYDEILENIIHEANYKIFEFKFKVKSSAFVDGKKISDIIWPGNCVVVSLKRIDTVIAPDGETILIADDVLSFRGEAEEADDLKNIIKELTGTDELLESEMT